MDNYNDSDDHYYALGYDVQSDPYVYENGVLINNFDIQNTHDLNEVEKKFTALTVRQLFNNPQFIFPVTINFYQALHKGIFSNIYPWAGDIRTVDICKGHTIFCQNQNIKNELNVVFEEINSNFFSLKSMSLDDLSLFIAKILGRLNHIHPFREGNGRTQRVFITGLLHIIDSECNYEIDWMTISNETMTRACIEFNEGNIKPMHKLIKLNITQSKK